jgi:hypothetical protein
MFATTHVLTRGLSSARLVFDRFRNILGETFSMARNVRRSVSEASLMIGPNGQGRVRDF